MRGGVGGLHVVNKDRALLTTRNGSYIHEHDIHNVPYPVIVLTFILPNINMKQICVRTRMRKFCVKDPQFLLWSSVKEPQFGPVLITDMQTPPPSEVTIFTWKIMRNVLKQIKNQFSNFFDFYFLSYSWFCTKVHR